MSINLLSSGIIPLNVPSVTTQQVNMNGPAPSITTGPSITGSRLMVSCSAGGGGNAVLIEAPISTDVSAITIRAMNGGIGTSSNSFNALTTSTGRSTLQLIALNSTEDTAIVIGAPSGGITMQVANDLNVSASAIVTTGSLVALTATPPEAIGLLVFRFGEAVPPAMQPMGLYMCTGVPTVPCSQGSFCFSANGNSYIATASNTWTAVSHA